MTSTFGFRQGDLEAIIQILIDISEINKAVIFGSRAKGNYKPGSDVDLVVWTNSNIAVLKLDGALNDETLLPYQFDILNYYAITNQDLKQHIDRVGIEIYKQ